jgi:phosphoribosylanthranilate isomerase
MSTEMQQSLVKICGISDPHHALVALDAGAHMIGLVFAKSPRRVSIDQASKIVEVVRSADPDGSMKIVGLFVNETPELMNNVAETVGLDVVQLSGDEAPQVVFKVSKPTIGSIRASSDKWQAAYRRLQDWVLVTPWAVHVDADVPGIYGGTGALGDWEIATQIAARYRTILAGGLTPANVSQAISKVRPFAVDVSTGVETRGVKDEQKIRAFIKAARSTTFELPENAYFRKIGRDSK